MRPLKNKLYVVVDGMIPTTSLVMRCLEEEFEFENAKTQTHLFEASEFEGEKLCSNACLLVRIAQTDFNEKVRKAINLKAKYIYLLDDNFWLLSGNSPLDEYYKNPMVRGALETIVSGAALVLCHSERFREFLLKYNPNVKVVPWYFDFSCLDGLSNRIDDITEKRIGIVANESRAKDLEIIVPAIVAVINKTKSDVFFEFFGYVPPALKAHPRVRYFPPVKDYRSFLREQSGRNWLVGLAPLLETSFTSFKSNNKYREFGGMGTAAIYSDVSIYRESVKNEQTGWLVPNDPKAWADRILDAIDQPALTRKIGQAAYQDVFQNYSLTHVRAVWIDALKPILKRKSAKDISKVIKNTLFRFYDAILPRTYSFVATKDGWKRRPLFVYLGFYNRPTIFSIEQNDLLATEVTSPINGQFSWSLTLLTFKKNLTGKLVIKVTGTGAQAEYVFKGEDLYDGITLSLSAELNADETIKVTIHNELSLAVALLALSPNGFSYYENTGKKFFGRFIA